MTDPVAADEGDEGDEGDDHGGGDGERTFVLIAVGVLAGVVAGTLAAWWLQTPPDRTAPVPALVSRPEIAAASPEAAESFVAAWERSRRETYLAVSAWHRVTDVGAESHQTRVLAQRPPDRVLSSGRTLSGEVGGVRYECDELAEDEVTCRELDTGFDEDDYAALVDEEVAAMWTYVEGDQPLYLVSRDGDCFELRLARGMHAPPYGRQARFCFDPESGAPSEIQVERDAGTDTVELLSVTSTVTDDDLEAVVTGSYEVPPSPGEE
ncbi:MAG: hypothetical protein U5K29_03330 [Acidimicrobiales bacterium]|nr:hypothetical protein [Acidimicrobiales bacterium]